MGGRGENGRGRSVGMRRFQKRPWWSTGSPVQAAWRIDFGFLQAFRGLVRVDIVSQVIIDVIGGATAKADDQAAVEQVVEERHLLGEADRVVERHLCDGEADPGVVYGRGEGGSEADRVDVGADAVEVVLGEPDGVEAEGVGEAGFFYRLLNDAAVIGGVAAFGEEEVAEFHAGDFRPAGRISRM